jgi:hypothetical protein
MSLDFSEAFPVTYRGNPAQIRVLRRDGYCWGRLIFDDGLEYDIDTEEDLYDWDDGDAADQLEHEARCGLLSEPVSDLIGWADDLDEA